jgi:hypothetical protein
MLSSCFPLKEDRARFGLLFLEAYSNKETWKGKEKEKVLSENEGRKKREREKFSFRLRSW